MEKKLNKEETCLRKNAFTRCHPYMMRAKSKYDLNEELNTALKKNYI